MSWIAVSLRMWRKQYQIIKKYIRRVFKCKRLWQPNEATFNNNKTEIIDAQQFPQSISAREDTVYLHQMTSQGFFKETHVLHVVTSSGIQHNSSHFIPRNIQ